MQVFSRNLPKVARLAQNSIGIWTLNNDFPDGGYVHLEIIGYPRSVVQTAIMTLWVSLLWRCVVSWSLGDYQRIFVKR